MKKIILMMIAWAGVIGIWGTTSYAQGLSKIEKEDTKVIYVVYDDSSSMYMDDGTNVYTDRWAQADYAIKALALMMNEGDTLRPYIMGNYQNLAAGASANNVYNTRTVVISRDKNDTLRDINVIMDEMKFAGQTYFQGVEAAVLDMKNQNIAGRDCWIIILTDGKFTEGANTKPSEIDSGEKLKEKLAEFTEENSGISIAYVPIGNCDIKFEQDRSKRIYTATGNSIMDQISQIVNLIYNRVQLNDDIRKQYIQQNNMDGKLYIQMDVPVEKMIVLLQDSEGPVLYKEIENLDEKLAQEIVNESPGATEAFRLNDEISFSGREDIPELYEGLTLRSYQPDKIMYSILRGKIYNFIGNNKSVGMRNQYVSIAANSTAYDMVDVYYQPAVFVHADYYLNGEKVEHGEECLRTSGNGQSENCIRAGELDVEIYLTDVNGNRIENQESALLYGNDFKVELRTQVGSPVASKRLNNFRYQFTVEEGVYVLSIVTSWNETYEQELNIQEPVLPLELELISSNTIMIDQQDGRESVISIQVSEGEDIISPASVEKAEVICESRDEDFEVIPLGYQGNGIWDFRIALTDFGKHKIAESIQCYVKAVRRYDSGTAKPEEAVSEAVYSLNIGSGDFELSVEPESEELRHCYRRIFWGESLPIKYLCNDVELTEKQKVEGLKITDFQISPSSMQQYFGIGRDNNLHLKKGLRWLFSEFAVKEIEVTMTVEYERYNTLESVLYQQVFTINYIPWLIRSAIYFCILAVVVLAVLRFTKRFSIFYVKKYKVFLRSERGGFPSKVMLKRRKHLWIPFCKTVHLVFKAASGVEEPMVDGFDIKIMKNISGDGWKIVNYNDFTGKGYKIGGQPVSEKNRVFGTAAPFSVDDKKGRAKVLFFDE